MDSPLDSDRAGAAAQPPAPWPAGEGAARLAPCLFSFVRLRHERFGALLFNPYLGEEEELDPTEAFLAAACDGRRSCRQVEEAASARLGLSREAAGRAAAALADRLRRAFALGLVPVAEREPPEPPALPAFPEDGPYLSAPKHVIWDVTYACNLRCKHCLTSSGKAWPAELDTRGALALLDALAEAQVLSLTVSGGEPLIRRDILTLLRRAGELGLRVEVATNGLVLPRAFLDALDAIPVFDVQVSLDGLGAEHDRFRGRAGAFDAACRSLRALREAGLSTSVSTTVTAENLDRLEALVDLAVELGCSAYKAIPLLPAGRAREADPRLRLDAAGMRRFTAIMTRARDARRGQIQIAMESCFAFLLDPPPDGAPADAPMGCSAGHDTLSIGADGQAYPCPFLHDLPLGNLLEVPLRELWQRSPRFAPLRTLSKQQMGEPCRSCAYAPDLCRGGCRAAAYLHTGYLAAADPCCPLAGARPAC